MAPPPPPPPPPQKVRRSPMATTTRSQGLGDLCSGGDGSNGPTALLAIILTTLSLCYISSSSSHPLAWASPLPPKIFGGGVGGIRSGILQVPHAGGGQESSLSSSSVVYNRAASYQTNSNTPRQYEQTARVIVAPAASSHHPHHGEQLLSSSSSILQHQQSASTAEQQFSNAFKDVVGDVRATLNSHAAQFDGKKS